MHQDQSEFPVQLALIWPDVWLFRPDKQTNSGVASGPGKFKVFGRSPLYMVLPRKAFCLDCWTRPDLESQARPAKPLSHISPGERNPCFPDEAEMLGMPGQRGAIRDVMRAAIFFHAQSAATVQWRGSSWLCFKLSFLLDSGALDTVPFLPHEMMLLGAGDIPQYIGF